MEVQVRSLQLQVGRLQFDALAAGDPAAELVLLLHGFPQFADSWLPVMPALAGAGFHAVAVDQRGYSPRARPGVKGQYALPMLVTDVRGFADALGADRFHLVGHDWGAVLAWAAAAQWPGRLLSMAALAVPHVDAFLHAATHNPDQMQRSAYVPFFRLPAIPEATLLAGRGALLRRMYQGRVPRAQVERNVQRLSQPGALTAALNWYRALDVSTRIGPVSVPALYIWGDQDIALGRAAALATAQHVRGPYRFVPLAGRSHWLLEDSTAEVRTLLLAHLQSYRSSHTT